MNGILLINKPEGFTSFDVIAKLRGMLKIKRLGHAGTLDPMATGVLPVFVGKATRACDILPDNEKSYLADFTLGYKTDTQDSTGTTIETSDKKVSRSELLIVLSKFRGDIKQLPPMYSAVSVNGKRLYDLARQGIEVEREARTITINSCELVSFDENSQSGELFISCTKGTYIRTIIHDIGEMLVCGGVMTGLVRKSSSGFKLNDCHTLEEVQSLCDNGEIADAVIDIDKAFSLYDEVRLNDIQTGMYRNGVRLDLSRVTHNNNSRIFRVYGNTGEFLGLATARNETNELVVMKNFF